jgi:hypothetical protein
MTRVAISNERGAERTGMFPAVLAPPRPPLSRPRMLVLGKVSVMRRRWISSGCASALRFIPLITSWDAGNEGVGVSLRSERPKDHPRRCSKGVSRV